MGPLSLTLVGLLAWASFRSLQRPLWYRSHRLTAREGNAGARIAGSLLVPLGAVALVAWREPGALRAFAATLGLALVATLAFLAADRLRLPPAAPPAIGAVCYAAALWVLDPWPWTHRDVGGALAGTLAGLIAVGLLVLLVEELRAKLMTRLEMLGLFGLVALLVAAAWWTWWGIGLGLTLILAVLAPVALVSFAMAPSSARDVMFVSSAYEQG